VALLLSYLSHLAHTNNSQGQGEMNNVMSEVKNMMSGLTSGQNNLAFSTSMSTATQQMNSVFMTSQQRNPNAPLAQQVPAQGYNTGYTVHQQPQPMQMGQMQPQPMQMGQMGGGMGLPPPPFNAPPPAYEGGKVDSIGSVAKPAF
jgi:hypothetical protein